MMTKQEYFQFAEGFFEQCLEISKKKNADYTGDTNDPFSNFKSVETLGVPTEVGFLTRMMDKMKRIASFVEKGELQVKDEAVEDTLNDLANYCCLMAGYIKSKDNRLVGMVDDFKEEVDVEFLQEAFREQPEPLIEAIIDDDEIPVPCMGNELDIYNPDEEE